MYDFGLTNEQKLLRQNVREFAENEIAPVAQQLDETETFSRPHQEDGRFGTLASWSPRVRRSSHGLSGIRHRRRGDCPDRRLTGCHGCCSQPAGHRTHILFRNEKQKKEWLPRLCRGEILASFGLTEPNAGSDAGASKTNARLENGSWVVNGSKIFITNSTSPMAGVCTVQAITGEKAGGKKEISCILVPNGTPGFTPKKMTGKMMWRSSDTGELYFDDCRVPEENLLESVEMASTRCSTLDNGRLAIGAMGLGGAQGAFELALKYARKGAVRRADFDLPVNAFKLADMDTEIEAARNLRCKACSSDAGLSFRKLAAMGKPTARGHGACLPGRPDPRRIRSHEGIQHRTLLQRLSCSPSVKEPPRSSARHLADDRLPP